MEIWTTKGVPFHINYKNKVSKTKKYGSLKNKFKNCILEYG